jgi:hypothetical protein
MTPLSFPVNWIIGSLLLLILGLFLSAYLQSAFGHRIRYRLQTLPDPKSSNFALTVASLTDSFAQAALFQQIEQFFVRRFAQSNGVNLRAWHKRPLWEKLQGRLGLLLRHSDVKFTAILPASVLGQMLQRVGADHSQLVE